MLAAIAASSMLDDKETKYAQEEVMPSHLMLNDFSHAL